MQVQSALHQLRAQGVVLLRRVQLIGPVQEALRHEAEALPDPEVVPEGELGLVDVACQYLHACKRQGTSSVRMLVMSAVPEHAGGPRNHSQERGIQGHLLH